MEPKKAKSILKRSSLLGPKIAMVFYSSRNDWTSREVPYLVVRTDSPEQTV